jgi:hypothetical protein
VTSARKDVERRFGDAQSATEGLFRRTEASANRTAK